MMQIRESENRAFRFAGPVLVSAAVATVIWVSAGDLNPPPGAIQPTNRVQLNAQAITLPYTISQPGSYVLTSNLTGSNGLDGFIIDADDVTLDLNGFALVGVTGSLDGVHVDGAHSNITVKNGTIRSWAARGISAALAVNGRFEGLSIGNCSNDGISVGSNSIIRVLSVTDNGAAGIHVAGNWNRIDSNNVTDNDRGIDVDGTDNIIIRNSAGNNTTDYDIGADNAYGPIVLVGQVGDITTVPNADHPWANFSLVCPITWCFDADDDTYGDPAVTTEACTQPSGYVSDCTDCDDAAPGINPGAPELCDGLDNNCNGQTDEGNPGGGGWCDTGLLGVCRDGTLQCQAGTLVCVQNTPPGPEVCDGLDNDCDGQTDELACPNGTSCETPTICQSRICVDGYCCNSSCTQFCYVCDFFRGLCTPVPPGQDPDNECPGAEACNGSGGCCRVTGQSCTSSGQCCSGSCVPLVNICF